MGGAGGIGVGNAGGPGVTAAKAARAARAASETVASPAMEGRDAAIHRSGGAANAPA